MSPPPPVGAITAISKSLLVHVLPHVLLGFGDLPAPSAERAAEGVVGVTTRAPEGLLGWCAARRERRRGPLRFARAVLNKGLPCSEAGPNPTPLCAPIAETSPAPALSDAGEGEGECAFLNVGPPTPKEPNPARVSPPSSPVTASRKKPSPMLSFVTPSAAEEGLFGDGALAAGACTLAIASRGVLTYCAGGSRAEGAPSLGAVASLSVKR